MLCLLICENGVKSFTPPDAVVKLAMEKAPSMPEIWRPKCKISQYPPIFSVHLLTKIKKRGHNRNMKREYGKDRTELLKMRINPDEKARIARIAKESGLSMSDLIRKAIRTLEKQKSA